MATRKKKSAKKKTKKKTAKKKTKKKTAKKKTKKKTAKKKTKKKSKKRTAKKTAKRKSKKGATKKKGKKKRGKKRGRMTAYPVEMPQSLIDVLEAMGPLLFSKSGKKWVLSPTGKAVATALAKHSDSPHSARD